MAGITEILQGLNIINLLNVILPPGLGELITLIMFNLSFAALGLFVVIWTLSKERLWLDVKARVTNEGKGIIIYPDGSSKERLIKRNIAALEEPLDGENNQRWIIRPDGWDRQSNGVPFTIFHCQLPYNVGATELAKFYKGYREEIEYLDENNQIQTRIKEHRPLVMSAREIDSNILKLANAEVTAMLDPNKKLVNAAIAISLIMITSFAIILFFIFMPKAPEAAPAAVEAVKVTTTTLAKSGIAGVTGG